MSSLNLSVPQVNGRYIFRVFLTGCDKPKDAVASVTCDEDIVTVIWPTDVIYNGVQKSVPTSVASVVSEKLKFDVNALELILYTRMPP